jgi:formate-dependent nitrite reductase complex subunit NrfG
MIIAILCALFFFILVGFYTLTHRGRSMLAPIAVFITIVVLSLSVWFTLIEHPTPKKSQAIVNQGKTIDAIIEEIQQQLFDDKNNPDLWFQLGQGYFANGDFESANTCFSYVLRLMDKPSSSVYAAKATAEYYINAQRMTATVTSLLEQSLSLDPNNDTALMLIANDHFISFRYPEAITVWQQILDSDRPGIDRAAIINSINKTKGLRN